MRKNQESCFWSLKTVSRPRGHYFILLYPRTPLPHFISTAPGVKQHLRGSGHRFISLETRHLSLNFSYCPRATLYPRVTTTAPGVTKQTRCWTGTRTAQVSMNSSTKPNFRMSQKVIFRRKLFTPTTQTCRRAKAETSVYHAFKWKLFTVNRLQSPSHPHFAWKCASPVRPFWPFRNVFVARQSLRAETAEVQEGKRSWFLVMSPMERCVSRSRLTNQIWVVLPTFHFYCEDNVDKNTHYLLKKKEMSVGFQPKNKKAEISSCF